MRKDEKKVEEPNEAQTTSAADSALRSRPFAHSVPQVPQSQRPALAALLRFDDDKRESLLSSLEEAGPTLIAEGIEDRISKALEVDGTEARAITYTLTSMYASQSFGVTASVIIRAIKGDPELAPLLAEANEENVGRFLDRLLSLKTSLGVVTKAYHLGLEHAKIFCSSEVTTDLRPIFDDTTESVIAAALFHSLRISFHESSTDGDFFVTLDTADLRQIREQIDLAIKKDTELRKLAVSINLPIVKE